MSAIALRLRSGVRRRWRAWLGLALLIGIGAGAAMALGQSARTTRDAYPRFADRQAAADVVVTGDNGFGLVGGGVDLDRLDGQAEVAAGARAFVGVPFVGELNGRRIDYADLLPVAARDGQLGNEIERWKMLDGRRADPRRVDEAVASFELAHRLGVGVGTQVHLHFYDAQSFTRTAAALLAAWPARLQARHEAAGSNLAGADGPELTVKIVGIESSPAEFPPLNTDLAPVLHLTPAFAARYSRAIVGTDVAYVRLQPHADVGAFQSEVEKVGGGKPVAFIETRISQSQKVQRSIDVEANVLTTVAALLAIAAAIAIAQAIARQSAVERADDARLHELGMQRIYITACAVSRTFVIAVVGLALAAVVASFGAPMVLLPLAREARVDDGPYFDPVVFVTGAALVLVLTIGVAAWTTRPSRLRERSDGERGRARGPAITRPLTAGLGIRLALGRIDSPAVGAVVGLAAATAILVGAVTFTHDLQRELANRHHYGLNWDQKVGAPGLPDVATVLTPALARDPRVGALAVGTVTAVHLNGVRADVLAVDQVKGMTTPTLVAGRAPEAEDEIALGARTARHAGVGIGDRVTARIGRVSKDLRVVGEAVFPEFGDAGQLGTGALMTYDGLRQVLPTAPRNTYLVRYADRSTVADERELVAAAIVPYPTRNDARPQDLVDLSRGDGLLGALAVALTVLAFVVLVHALISATRRSRHEFAVLRGLGLRRRQVWFTIGWQVLTIIAAALAIGIPIGMLAGQLGWQRFAASLGVEADGGIPVVPLALVFAGALVIGALAAVVPAYLATRIRPARALRTA